MLCRINNIMGNIKQHSTEFHKALIFAKENYFPPSKKTEYISQNSQISKNSDSINNKCSEYYFKDICLVIHENKEKILLFNKVRNDKRHRKQAFQKRGYWKKMHYFTRKNNIMCYAFKVQNICYEKIKKLKRGEI